MIFIPVVILVIWIVVRDLKEAKSESEAIDLDCLMSKKFLELHDDPFMNDKKWREWLPVFEFADEEVRRKAPRLSLGNQTRIVRTMIPDQDTIDS